MCESLTPEVIEALAETVQGIAFFVLFGFMVWLGAR